MLDNEVGVGVLKKGVESEMRLEINEKEAEITIHKWTPFTIELLKLYSDYFNEIVVHQKVANKGSSVSKRKRENYRLWSDKDDRFVIENRDKKSIEEMAVKLNRTESAVRHRAYELENKNPEKKRVVPPDNTDLVAPDNTDLFLKWVESWKKGEFETSDFISAYPQISEKDATKIMVYQVQRGNLYQMGKDAFVVKREE